MEPRRRPAGGDEAPPHASSSKRHEIKPLSPVSQEVMLCQSETVGAATALVSR